MALISSGGQLTITAAGGTGNKTYAHGLPFTPELLRFTSNGVAAGVASGSNVNVLNGWAKSASEQWVVSTFSEDNVAASDTRSIMRNDACIVTLTQTGAVGEDMRAVFVSVDGTNITLNITDAPTADLSVQFLGMLGDGMEVDVGTIEIATTDSGTINYDVVGFEPVGMLFGTVLEIITEGLVDTNISLGAWAANGGKWCASWLSDDNVNPSNENTVLVTTRVVYQVSASNPASVLTELTFGAARPTGFSLTITDAPNSTRTIGYVAFGGENLHAFAGTGAQPATPDAVSYPTTGVTPQLVLLTGTHVTAAGTPVAGTQVSLGWATETENRAIATSGTDNVTPSETGRSTSATTCIRYVAGAAGATVAEASLSAVADGEFVLDWPTADATQRLFGFLALELRDTGGGSAAGSRLLRAPLRSPLVSAM